MKQVFCFSYLEYLLITNIVSQSYLLSLESSVACYLSNIHRNCLRAQAQVHLTHAIYYYLVKLEHTLLYDLFIIIFIHSVLSPYCWLL